MSTYTGDYTTTQSLVRFEQPATVARTGYFNVASGDAIYGYPGHYWSVLNLGTVYSTEPSSGVGIALNGSGAVTNGQSGTTQDSAQIRGTLVGVLIAGYTAVVTNYGRIGVGKLPSQGSSVYGVQLITTTGGTVTNGSYGLIYGHNTAVVTQGGRDLVTNSGRILGPEFSGYAVKLAGTDSASVSNGGYIGGGTGIKAEHALATVTNTGTVEGKGTAASSGYGILLEAGGAVYNGLKLFEQGYIFGREGGVAIDNAPGTVVNLDRIVAGAASFGVQLYDGGSLVNGSSGDTGASIVAGDGARIANAGTVTNFGTIEGTDAGLGTGLRLDGFFDGLRIVNNTGASALISGPDFGILAAGQPVSVANSGTIEESAANGIGIDLSGGGGDASSTVTNAGTIAGDKVALQFSDGNDRLIVEPGAVFTGIVDAGGGLDEIDFAAPGTERLNPEYVGFGVVDLASGGADTLALTNADFTEVAGSVITVSGGNNGNTIDASGVTNATNRVVLTGRAGKDVFTGGAGADEFKFSAAGLAATDRVTGGGGSDELFVNSAGTIHADGVAGVEAFRLAGGAANVLTLGNANFAGVIDARIRVVGGSGGNTVDGSALGAANRLEAVGGAGKDVLTGGAGADIFEFSAAALSSADRVKGGGGTDELLITAAGTVNVAGVSQVEDYRIANGGPNVLTLAAGNFSGVAGATITVTGGNAGNTVNAVALGATDKVIFVGGAGADSFTGGAGADMFEFAAANLTAADTVQGNGGVDLLTITTAGAVGAAGVSGVETIRLSGAGTDTLVLDDGNFADVAGAVTVIGGGRGNVVNAGALSAGHAVTVSGGAGTDSFTGGAGNDTFSFVTSALGAADTVQGRDGNDTLTLTGSGTVNIAGVNGIETIRLGSGGANSLTLADGNFTGVTGATITVVGGSAGNTISEAAVSAGNLAVLVGGSGADILIAGHHATMTGGSGADVFEFHNFGSVSNTVTSFAHNIDELAFSNGVFKLGQTGAGATPKPLPPSLFSSKTDGTFDNTTERFAYDKATGALYYDADGSGSGGARHLVVTLANRPAVTASDLFYVS